jgi:hypothetical protein
MLNAALLGDIERRRGEIDSKCAIVGLGHGGDFAAPAGIRGGDAALYGRKYLDKASNGLVGLYNQGIYTTSNCYI